MAGDYQIENGILKRYTGREETIEIPEGIHTIGEGALKGCVFLFVAAGLVRWLGSGLISQETLAHTHLLPFFFTVNPLDFLNHL